MKAIIDVLAWRHFHLLHIRFKRNPILSYFISQQSACQRVYRVRPRRNGADTRLEVKSSALVSGSWGFCRPGVLPNWAVEPPFHRTPGRPIGLIFYGLPLGHQSLFHTTFHNSSLYLSETWLLRGFGKLGRKHGRFILCLICFFSFPPKCFVVFN